MEGDDTDDERDGQMLIEGERGRKEGRREYREKKIRQGCGERERETERWRGMGRREEHTAVKV